MYRLWRARRLYRASVFVEMSKKCKLDAGSVSTGMCSGKGPPINSLPNDTVEKTPGYSYLAPTVKSPADKKEYSVIRLYNGLTALLVTDHPVVSLDESGEASESDGESEASRSESDLSDTENEDKIAACALCVGVGSFSDPPDIPGLAHFLEHMVFMGSEKYPAENEFDSFIKRKGGSDNASTQCQHTTFYFECQEEHLKEAMDIFSQFFISPLMKYEAMARERQAIESEFNMALPSDDYRRTQLLCSLADKKNPAGKFMWGNLETLQDNVEDKKLYDAVHEFRRRHYSAHRMTLAVQARLPQHMLASWVRDSFSKVENNLLGPDKHEILENPFTLETFNRLYYVEPVNDICEVELTWSLPPLQHLYKKKPLSYISWLMGHEGKGGLLSWLRRRVWALGIVADEVEDIGSNSLFSLFSIKIELSEEGYENLEKCLEGTFSYIKFLRTTGPVQRIYDEIKKMSDNNFRYFDEISPVENVENLVENMQLYPSEHYITGSELHFEYDPVEIQKIMDSLLPTNVNIMISSKRVIEENVLDQTEKWFGTKYTSKAIPEEWVDSWTAASTAGEFNLPEPNIYLPDNFTILPVEGEHSTAKYPRKIKSNDIMELWFKEDVKFKLPQAYLYFYLMSPEHAAGALQRTMVDMYTAALGQLLTEETYPAVVAEMGYKISSVERGLVICVYGFDQNLHLLVDKFTEGMLDFKKNMTRELFDAVKRLQYRFYTNQNLRAGVLASELRMTTTIDNYWPITERLKALPQITYEHLLDFSEKYFECMYVKGLVQGNMSEERANEIGIRLSERLVKKPLKQKQEVRVCRLNNGQTNIRAKSFNLEDTNCITTTYFQHGPGNIREYCILEILMMLLEEPLFDTLRTREQLGYDVSCRLRDTYGILGFTIKVVSQRDKVTVDHVEERIKSFLVSSLQRLEGIGREEFDEAVTAIVKLKQYSDVHLKEEVSRNWAEIINDEFVFDRLEREVQNLQNIEPGEVHAFLAALLSGEGKLFLIQVVSDKEPFDANDLTTIQFLPPATDKTDQIFITDPLDYKKQLYVYPPCKIDR